MVATLLIRFILTPLGVLGVHDIAALSVSEQVFVSVYSILVIAVDIDTVWEFDPFTEVSVPDIVATLLLKPHDTPFGVLGVHAMAALNVSEHVVDSVY